jgi:ribosomal protein S18 acetylase RimI-like enzyme
MATQGLPAAGVVPCPARPDEWEEAFALLFQHCPPEERRPRVLRALGLIEKNELSPEGVLVLRDTGGLLGAAVGTVVPGGSGLVWPPQTVNDPRRILHEDILARHVLAWLRQQGARLAQCLLAPEEVGLAAPLLRNGFQRITDLWYLRQERALQPFVLGSPSRLTLQTYDEADRDLFHATLWRTYEGTLDCPEVAGRRTLQDIVTGHKAQGDFDPSLWWLGRVGDEAVGVLLVAKAKPLVWEVAYVGVVPEARRQGFGRELMLHVLLESRAEEVRELFLTVDGRNHAAWELYRSLGFAVFDKREVFLALWDD